MRPSFRRRSATVRRFASASFSARDVSILAYTISSFSSEFNGTGSSSTSGNLMAATATLSLLPIAIAISHVNRAFFAISIFSPKLRMSAHASIGNTFSSGSSSTSPSTFNSTRSLLNISFSGGCSLLLNASSSSGLVSCSFAFASLIAFIRFGTGFNAIVVVSKRDRLRLMRLLTVTVSTSPNKISHSSFMNCPLSPSSSAFSMTPSDTRTMPRILLLARLFLFGIGEDDGEEETDNESFSPSPLPPSRLLFLISSARSRGLLAYSKPLPLPLLLSSFSPSSSHLSANSSKRTVLVSAFAPPTPRLSKSPNARVTKIPSARSPVTTPPIFLTLSASSKLAFTV
mmetsp:Transcript_2583/g.8255  ORF Transcript_2583/g.8255 Transcript_2583/m.8255 type:complete len:343 (+) Transcript_2583:14896-15924(+)